jgi:solute carrier family 6 amino acid transporter-like protein 5/7/9/14
MLYVLGLGSAVALLGAVITVVRDSFPKLKYLLVAVVACVLGFIAGLVYITPVSKYDILVCAVQRVKTQNT